jgi:hypothetical protein
VYKHFGLPLQIISDRDPHFLSNFWCALTGYFDTHLAMSTSHHPQTDGQTEVMNQHLETMIQSYVNADHNNWADWLDILASAYNRATHLSTLTSPSALLMGFTPRMPLHLLQESVGQIATDSPLADDRISALHV